MYTWFRVSGFVLDGSRLEIEGSEFEGSGSGFRV